MNPLRTSGVGQAVAAVLVLVLMLAGLGRGLAAAAEMRVPPPTIAGAVAPICHSDGGSANPVDPGGHHDCCEQCALGAPVILAGSPDFARAAPVAHAVPTAAVVAWKVRLARARTPRQSQGPPVA